MNDLVETIEVTQKLYEARDVIRRLHGDDYPKVIEQFKGFVTSEMEQKKVNALQAGINIVTDLQRDCPGSDMTQAMILAACVELIDPYKP